MRTSIALAAFQAVALAFFADGVTVDFAKENGRIRRLNGLCNTAKIGNSMHAKNDQLPRIKFLNEFQDRLMFGMDLCQPQAERSFKPLLPPYLKELRDSGEISQDVFFKVARGNAIRELGL